MSPTDETAMLKDPRWGVRLTGAALRVVTESKTEIAGLPVPPTMADHVILEGDGADTWVTLVWRLTEALHAKAILFKGVEDIPLVSTRVARVSLAGDRKSVV